MARHHQIKASSLLHFRLCRPLGPAGAILYLYKEKTVSSLAGSGGFLSSMTVYWERASF